MAHILYQTLHQFQSLKNYCAPKNGKLVIKKGKKKLNTCTFFTR